MYDNARAKELRLRAKARGLELEDEGEDVEGGRAEERKDGQVELPI